MRSVNAFAFFFFISATASIRFFMRSSVASSFSQPLHLHSPLTHTLPAAKHTQ